MAHLKNLDACVLTLEVQPEIASAYFPDPTTMGRGNVESASTSLRGTLAGVQVRLTRPLSL